MYPNAYFILTMRDFEEWYNSLLAIYQQFDKNLSNILKTTLSFSSYGNYFFFKKIFQIDTLTNEDTEFKIKSCFDNYNKKVRNFFENSKYKFLEIDISKNNSTYHIFKFLNKKNYNIEILHLNKGNY